MFYLFQGVDRPVAYHSRDLIGGFESGGLLNHSDNGQRLKVLGSVEHDRGTGNQLVRGRVAEVSLSNRVTERMVDIGFGELEGELWSAHLPFRFWKQQAVVLRAYGNSEGLFWVELQRRRAVPDVIGEGVDRCCFGRRGSKRLTHD